MIFLVRHGEPAAAWGAHPDPGLSDVGKLQAEAAAETLLAAGARRIISSPLARCRQSARPLEMRLEAHTRIESRVGEVTTPDAIEDRPAWLRNVMAGTWAEAGEALDAWRRSVLGAIEECPEGTAIFTHFVAINAALSLIERTDQVLSFRPAHASITRLERAGGRLRVILRGAEGEAKAL